MIESFGCKYTEMVWRSKPTKKWGVEIANKALRKLFILDAADDIRDLKIPPSNRLHKLKGNLKDYHPISINNKWRIIFKWRNGNANDVQIIDYH